MKKIPVLLFAIFVSAVLYAGGGDQKSSPASTAPVQQKEIRVLLANQPYAEMLMPKLGEFEKQTGIKIVWESLQEFQLSNKLTTEFATGVPTVDVFMTRPLQEAMMFNKNGWYAPLDNYDFSDYSPSAVELGKKDGKPHIVPILIEWQVLFYRKDLFQKAGLSVPTTFAELENAAKILNRDGVAGFGSRAAAFASIPQLSSYIFGFGGRYLENGAAVFDSPEAVEAFRYYGRILGNYAPQGVTAMSWEQLLPVFQAGKLAMWVDVPIWLEQLTNPAKSTVPAENVGVANFPAGPKRDNPFVIVPWGFAISAKTKDMDSSMKFLNWATSKEMANIALKGSLQVARNSPWNDPAIKPGINPGILASMEHAFKAGFPEDRPIMTSVGKARDLIGEIVTESINTKGTSAKLQALATQKAKEVNDLLKADGEYGGK